MAQNVNGEGSGESKKAEDAALRARLDSLSSALDARRNEPEAGAKSEADLSSQSLGQAMNLGFRVLAEFVAAIGVGTLIGWQLDVWFHTGPILLIIFLMLGTAAGFMNIYRLAMGPTGPKRGAQ
jgi:ATP synthase protein I